MRPSAPVSLIATQSPGERLAAALLASLLAALGTIRTLSYGLLKPARLA
jgi:hypothetical protein